MARRPRRHRSAGGQRDDRSQQPLVFPGADRSRGGDPRRGSRANVDRLTEEVIDERRIYDARSLKIHILAQDVPTTTREGKRLRRLARLATTYERQVEAAVKASRYPDLADEHQARLYDVQKILRAILHAPPPLTPIGLTVVARALLAVAEINEAEGKDHLTVGLDNALGIHLGKAMLAGKVGR